MTSLRQVFRSSAVIGGASLVNIVIGVAKVKVLAVLLGPAGIGLMGLLQNVMAVASSVAGCGVHTSGVRQLAANPEDANTTALVRRSLLSAIALLGVAGLLGVWLLRASISRWVFDDDIYAREVGWLGFGVLLTLIAGAHTAVLQGLRRVDDLAKVSILSAIVGALTGVATVYWLGRDGVVWFVLLAPAANALVAYIFARRVPLANAAWDNRAVRGQWRSMLQLGVPLMAAGLVMLLTQLAARAIVLREFGLEASGLFQAAWAISMIYVGLVLNALATDYYPRLSSDIGDPARATAIVHEQVEMTLLLAAPALMAMITLAPWVTRLLYSDDFGPAADILRWQAVGDVLKVASAPVVFVFLASGRGGLAIGVQLAWSAAYLGALLLGLPGLGLVSTGVSFAVAFAAYYLIVATAAYGLIGYKPARRHAGFILLLLVCGGATIALSHQSLTAGYGFGLAATVIISAYSARRLNRLIDITGWLRGRLSGP